GLGADDGRLTGCGIRFLLLERVLGLLDAQLLLVKGGALVGDLRFGLRALGGDLLSRLEKALLLEPLRFALRVLDRLGRAGSRVLSRLLRRGARAGEGQHAPRGQSERDQNGDDGDDAHDRSSPAPPGTTTVSPSMSGGKRDQGTARGGRVDGFV